MKNGVMVAWLLIALLAGCIPSPQVDATVTSTVALAVSPPSPSPTLRPSATPRPTSTATARPTRRPTATMIPTWTPRPATATVTALPPTLTPLPPTATPVPPTPQAVTPTVLASPPSATTGSPLPQRLVIPGIGISAVVEYVGKDAEGRMEVPDGWWNVGWYQPGTLPGARGSAVMAGHFDSTTGRAVFWDLGLLGVGDEVIVVDGRGVELRFQVIGKEIYDYDDAPLQRIFNANDGTYLNLITCNGTFDQNARNYDKRLVVYTQYVGP